MTDSTDDYDIEDWKRELARLVQSAHDLGLCPLEVSIALSEAVEEIDDNMIISPGTNFPAPQQ